MLHMLTLGWLKLENTVSVQNQAGAGQTSWEAELLLSLLFNLSPHPRHVPHRQILGEVRLCKAKLSSLFAGIPEAENWFLRFYPIAD